MLGFHSISAAPISARPSLATAASSDLSPYAGSNSSLAARQVQNAQRAAQSANSRVWINPDSTAVASSDLAPYAQSLARRITRAVSGSAWVDLTAAVSAPVDLPVYAQSVARFAQQRIKTAVWVDLDTTVTVSSDLSPYAQSSAQPVLLSPKQRSLGAYSRVWVDIDPSAAVASSDLSPYAQTRVVESWWRTTRRGTGTGWNSGDDFFPPQDALSVYGQSCYLQAKVANRPLGQGAAWVDLLDAIASITPPGSSPGGGGGGAGRFRVSFEDADRIRQRLRDIEIKRRKSWKDPKRLERQLQQIYADLYETEHRDELPPLQPLAVTASPLATFKPDFAPLLKDLTAIRRLLDLYQTYLDEEEAVALLLLL